MDNKDEKKRLKEGNEKYNLGKEKSKPKEQKPNVIVISTEKPKKKDK